MQTKTAFLVLLVVLFGVSACHHQPTAADLQNAYYGDYPQNYEEIINKHIENVFYDPYSAKVNFPVSPSQGYYSKPFGGGVEYGYHGTVMINAKNQMGAYTGLKRYNYVIRDGRIIVFEEARVNY